MNTPYFLIEEEKLEKNLLLLRSVAERAGCKILLAQKAYSVYQTYPLISDYLDGSTASGVYEARLGREEFGKEVHAYSPAFREEDVKELASLCDHIVFNTPAQVKKYAPLCREKGVSVGLRINPECSTQEGHAIYDPCAPGSRLGTTLANFDESVLPLLDGLHFHTLCEQNSDDLEVTVRAFCDKFGKYLPRMKWLNLGGGHHITRADYDVDRLVCIVRGLKEKYGVQLSPGRPHLPCGRRDRRLFFRQPPERGGRARVRGHGAVHHGQDEHLQRNAPARHTLSWQRRENTDVAGIFLRRF